MGHMPAFNSSAMNDSELDKILLSAGNTPPLPPDFRRQVWLRLESSSAASLGLASWFGKVSELHAAYRPECTAMCQRIAEAHERLDTASHGET